MPRLRACLDQGSGKGEYAPSGGWEWCCLTTRTSGGGVRNRGATCRIKLRQNSRCAEGLHVGWRFIRTVAVVESPWAQAAGQF